LFFITQTKQSAVRESIGTFDAELDGGRYRTAFYIVDQVFILSLSYHLLIIIEILK
jgi:hypothetical protein